MSIYNHKKRQMPNFKILKEENFLLPKSIASWSFSSNYTEDFGIKLRHIGRIDKDSVAILQGVTTGVYGYEGTN